MFYLITQLLLLLAIASLLSGAIGWICRRYFTEQAHLDQIRDHKRAGRQHLSEIDDLRRDLTDRNTQVASLNSKLHYNKDAMDQSEAQRNSLLRDLEDLHGLENQLHAVEQDRLALDQQLAASEADLDHTRRTQLENEEAWQKALAEKEQRLLAANALTSDKEQQLKAALTSKADKEKQQKDATTAKAQTEKQLHNTAIAAAENEEKLRSAATVNANLEDIIASLNNDIKTKTAEREKANQAHALLSADLGRLDKKLGQTVQDDNARINALENSLRAEKDAHTTAKHAIASGEQKLKAVEATLAERTKERDKLEKLCAEQQQEIAALKRELAKAQKAAADAQITNQKQVANLEHELDKQKTIGAAADRQVASENQAKQQVQKALDKLQAELKDAQAQKASQSLAAAERLDQQKLATADSNSAAAAAEKQLAELKQDHTNLKKSADQQLRDLHSSETEAAKLAEKEAAAAARIADLESRLANQGKSSDSAQQQLRRDLDNVTAKLAARDSELRDAVNQSLELQNSVADYQSTDAELRAMIAKLQHMLSEERRSAGQSLLSRIRELEAMLEAERRKADELKSAGPEIGKVSWQSKSTTRTVAANSSTVSSKKTGTDNKK